jgi:hypothetical protein
MPKAQTSPGEAVMEFSGNVLCGVIQVALLAFNSMIRSS